MSRRARTSRESGIGRWMTAVIGACAVAAACAADTVTLRGSSIPIRELHIQSIRAGEVYYLDRSGRPERAPLDDISRLGFDALPKLDTAEDALAKGERDQALNLLLQALLEAEQPIHRLWVHARLSRLHDVRGEYVPAAGHAAAVMMLEPSAFWRLLEPTCQPVEPTYAQAVEAGELLREAARQVTDGTLRQAIDRMRQVVQPIRQRLAEQYNGPPIAQGSTWSGFARRRIADGTILTDETAHTDGDDAAETVMAAPIEPTDDSDVAVESARGESDAAGADNSPAAPTRVVDTERADKLADDIDALLEAGDFAQALNMCESAGEQAAERDVARLLHQWGLALHGVDRQRDASIMFTRCAVLFPGTEHGLHCLIETAMLYKSVYRQPATSRRLLQRAVDQAQMQGREAIANRAREMMRDLGGRP